MTRRIQIIDLDGCISDDRWRQPYLPDYDMYYVGMLYDRAVNLREIKGEEIVVLTGRPVRYRAQTDLWLRSVAKLRYLHLIMRNDHDHCPAVVLKRRMVAGLFDANSYCIHPEEITDAIDDLDDIVQMYRTEFNLKARVVRISNGRS